MLALMVTDVCHCPVYHCRLQLAGIEGRHIVLLLTDSNITDEAMLADVNGLLNTGDVTGRRVYTA
jgi:hypothetical protein